MYVYAYAWILRMCVWISLVFVRSFSLSLSLSRYIVNFQNHRSRIAPRISLYFIFILRYVCLGIFDFDLSVYYTWLLRIIVIIIIIFFYSLSIDWWNKSCESIMHFYLYTWNIRGNEKFRRFFWLIKVESTVLRFFFFIWKNF